MFQRTQAISDSIRSFVLYHLMYYKAVLANRKQGGEVQISWHRIIQPSWAKMVLSLFEQKNNPI